MGVETTYYVFKGGESYEGICRESIRSLKSALCKAHPRAEVLEWNNEGESPALWESGSVLVLPGGECSKWSLSKELQKQLLRWIENGGKHIGDMRGRLFLLKKI